MRSRSMSNTHGISGVMRSLSRCAAVAGLLVAAVPAHALTVVIDRVEIERSSALTLGDYLRELPLNSFGSARAHDGNDVSAQSLTALSLRGLGSGRTLLLVDGVQLPQAPFAPGAQDVDALPLAAVERIEISTGGMAVLGADGAAGGRVNIVTRRELAGVELQAGIGSPTAAGGETEHGSIVVGLQGAQARALAGVAYADRGMVHLRDRPWSSTGAGSSFANNLREVLPPYDGTFGTYFSHPVHGQVLPGFACDTAPFFIGSGEPRQCLYEFAVTGSSDVDMRRSSAFVNADYQPDATSLLYVDASVSRSESFNELPRPFGELLLAPGDPFHPAVRLPGAGYDPAAYFLLRHRFAGIERHDVATDGRLYRGVLGGRTTLGRFVADLRLHSAEHVEQELGRGFIVRPLAQQAISDGRYDPYDPFGIDADLARSITATRVRDGSYRTRGAQLVASTTLGRIGRWRGRLESGLDARSEQLDTVLHDRSLRSPVLSGSPLSHAVAGRREVRAAFMRWSVAADRFDLAIGGRYTDYSDVGGATSAALEAGWSPAGELRVNASYARSHVAPSLAEANAPTRNYSFSTFSVPAYEVANPALRPEVAEQVALRLRWPFARQWQLEAGGYAVSIDERIRLLSASHVYFCALGTSPACDFAFATFTTTDQPRPELGIAAAYDSHGRLLFVQNGLVNAGRIDTRGFDLLLDGAAMTRLGGLSSRLWIAYVERYSVDDGRNLAGDPAMPRVRARWQSTWTHQRLALTWTSAYVDRTRSTYAIEPWQADDPTLLELPSWTTHDVQLAWEWSSGGRLVFGVDNLFDRSPVLDPYGPGSNGFAVELYDGYGRTPYLRYVRTFGP